MGRFDPPTTMEDPVLPVLVSVQDTLAALADAVALLAMRQDPAPEVHVDAPHVTVPLDSLLEEMRTISERLDRPERPVPSVPSRITADVDLAPLLEAEQETLAAIASLKESMANRVSGPRSHFDGRLRTDTGPVGPANPLSVVITASNEALETAQYDVTATPTLIHTSTSSYTTVVVANLNLTDRVWAGTEAGFTPGPAGTGFPLAAGGALSIDMNVGDTLYVASESGTVRIAKLVTY